MKRHDVSSRIRATVGAVMVGAALAAVMTPDAVRAAGPEVTVYTRDLGFVRETRSVALAGSNDTLRITGVPDRLDFSSVRLAVPGARVDRLAYRYDLASGDLFLEQARGSRVRVVSRGDRNAEGTLLAVDGSWLVLRGNDGAILTLSRASVEDVRMTQPTAATSLRPTLEAVVEGGKRGNVDAELSYLTGGLSWSAEHTLIRTGDGSGEWSAIVTIENQSGREYRDAELKLVAGEPRRTSPMPVPMVQMARGMELKAMNAEGVDLSEQNFSEYHLYTLDRPATLRDRETQSLTMLPTHAVKITPRYFFRGGGGVSAQLELRNTKAEGLGVPLAGGRVRFFERDASGSLQFTGETNVRHTPEGEKLTLDVGTAFDLVAERRETSNKRISDREREYTVEVKLRNQKKTNVTIVVAENVPNDSDVLAKSHDFTRKDSQTLEFAVPVAAGKESVLTFTVRARY